MQGAVDLAKRESDFNGNFQVVDALLLSDGCRKQAAPPSEASTLPAEVHLVVVLSCFN